MDETGITASHVLLTFAHGSTFGSEATETAIKLARQYWVDAGSLRSPAAPVPSDSSWDRP